MTPRAPTQLIEPVSVLREFDDPPDEGLNFAVRKDKRRVDWCEQLRGSSVRRAKYRYAAGESLQQRETPILELARA
jgi:hypothetical protein